MFTSVIVPAEPTSIEFERVGHANSHGSYSTAAKLARRIRVASILLPQTGRRNSRGGYSTAANWATRIRETGRQRVNISLSSKATFIQFCCHS